MLRAIKQTAFVLAAGAAAFSFAAPASAAMQLNANGTVTVSGSSGGSVILNMGGNSEGVDYPNLSSTMSAKLYQCGEWALHVQLHACEYVGGADDVAT